VVVLATGSEVPLVLRAHEELAAEGLPTRVVSLPSWEVFEAQPRAYRDEVLPAGIARVAVEAGVRFGWERWVGSDGIVVSVDRYGASAPGQVAMEKLGFNLQNVKDAIRRAAGAGGRPLASQRAATREGDATDGQARAESSAASGRRPDEARLAVDEQEEFAKEDGDEEGVSGQMAFESGSILPSLELDPSRPYQLEGHLMAVWLPRGRGRSDLAHGFLCTVSVCDNPACLCTDAILQGRLIDDRVERAEASGSSITLFARGGAKYADRSFDIELNFLTGGLKMYDGTAVPRELEPFFREPIPGWVLDDICLLWSGLRPGLRPWQQAALANWEPGEPLSLFLSHPDERFDQFLIDGKKLQVDLEFSVEPDGESCDAVFAVYEVGARDAEITLTQVGAAAIPLDTMMPRILGGGPDFSAVLSKVFLAWYARHAPARQRLESVRDRVRLRGAELCRMVRAADAARSGAQAKPAPSRNGPCPCGSGRKYKRCCGRT
jgi:hypothetical protein